MSSRKRLTDLPSTLTARRYNDIKRSCDNQLLFFAPESDFAGFCDLGVEIYVTLCYTGIVEREMQAAT